MTFFGPSIRNGLSLGLGTIPSLATGGALAPSLDLIFAGASALDSQVTFTRASTATYFNSAGTLTTAAINEARFDYNPSTLAAQGLLIEESRANICLQSEDFATTWTNTNSTEQTNVLVAPNGTLTADLLQADAVTTASARDLRQNVNGTVSAAHSFSVFAKAKDGNFLGLTFRNQAASANNISAEFNLSTGVVSVAAANGGTATGATASITAINNGWYRCSISGIADTSGTQFTVILTGRTTSNNNNVSANTELCYIWGAQLEAGAFPTSYIPTTTTALTRAADAASVNTLSPWYNASAGTLYAEGSIFGLNATNRSLSNFTDGTSNNRISIYRQSDTQPVSQVLLGGASQFTIGFGTTWTTETTRKIALAFASADFATCLNGGSVSAQTSGTVPTVSALWLGSLNGTSQFQCGYLRRITYYPRRLSNAELQAITA